MFIFSVVGVQFQRRCCSFQNDATVQSLRRYCSMDGDIFKMLTLDYIIANEDRHFNNFGFIRDAETLEWIGLAPVFDCGTSLWHNSLDVGGERKCQPFCKNHEEQLRLVSDLSWFDFESLHGAKQEIAEIFSCSPVIDNVRGKAIASAVLSRAEAVARRW